MSDQKKPSIKIMSNIEGFEGVTVHMFQLVTGGDEARLDCIYVDQGAVVSGEGEASAKVVARLNMSKNRLIELRNLLNQHISAWDQN